jgi:hypothetical protein
MKLNDNPTLEQFRELLRQHDDRAGHHVLWARNEQPRTSPTISNPSARKVRRAPSSQKGPSEDRNSRPIRQSTTYGPGYFVLS